MVLVGGIVLMAVVTVAGGFFSAPMGVSYVQTNSMSPTLQPGDGFILVPTELAGELASGDVIVFRAERLGGGGPTTHRIVAETDRGYITQGDNNNAPDQAGVEPPVQQAQVIGEALRINGQLVVLPNVGLVGQQAEGGLEAAQQFFEVASWRLGGGSKILSSVNFTHGIALVFILLYFGESVRERLVSSRRDGRNRERVNEKKEQRESFHTIILALTAVVVLAMTAAMVVPGGAQERGVVVSQTSTPATANPGEEVEFNHTIGNSDVIPMTVFLESGEDLTLNRRQISLSRGEIATISGRAFAPQSVGYHRFFVTEHWYFPLLPTKTINILYNIHPWAPIVVIDAIVAVPYYLFGRHILYGGLPTRTRSRDRA
ncbi:signal peptidase I [Halorubrum distributum]|nr:signal peptidase I [Halorubrum terrestre]